MEVNVPKMIPAVWGRGGRHLQLHCLALSASTRTEGNQYIVMSFKPRHLLIRTQPDPALDCCVNTGS